MLANLRKTDPVKWLSSVAVLMALNVIFSSFSIPVPGGHLYLNDAIICTSALLLDPPGAFMVGGVGAFLGDLMFYPQAMLVSLVAHGLEALIISLFVRTKKAEGRFLPALLGVLLGGALMVLCYTLGRAYVYGAKSWEVSLIKLPFEILQAAVGGVSGLILVYKLKIGERIKNAVRL